MSHTVENVVIIGSGPAGHTAAVYTARARLQPLLFEGFMAGGIAAGGQLTTTTEVENFPGFPAGIGGPELMDRMRQQSLNCGARIETKTVDRVDLDASPFKVFTSSQEILTRTLIIATGATAKRLDVPGGERLWQKGISACAVCDGALPAFRDRHLVVVGGGDSAAEESTYLTKYASQVSLLVRRDVLRASSAMQERLSQNEKIKILWNTNLVEVMGANQLEKIKVSNNRTKEVFEMEAGGLFFAIGHTPNTAFLGGQLERDETGYLVTRPGSTATSRAGVFACGDVQDKVWRQAITAAGTGCMAALATERWLGDQTCKRCP